MGEFNSSKTRVCPLGRAITNNYKLINEMLGLLNIDIRINDIETIRYQDLENHQTEISLLPTRTHLKSILDKIIADKDYKESIKTKATKGVSEYSKKKRELLFNDDQDTILEAYDIIMNKDLTHKKNKWAIFESASKPDLYIESKDYIIVIEGKRTETSTTNSVTYLPKRSQMIRHTENAINTSNGKKVISFYILNENCTYKSMCNKEHLKKELEEETITVPNKEEVSNAFQGYLTWEEISSKLHIIYNN